MNALYQDFKERFGMEGLVITAATAIVGLGIGACVGIAISLNIKPAVVIIEDFKNTETK